MYQLLQNRNMPTGVLAVACNWAAPFTISNWQHLARNIFCGVKNLVIPKEILCFHVCHNAKWFQKKLSVKAVLMLNVEGKSPLLHNLHNIFSTYRNTVFEYMWRRVRTAVQVTAQLVDISDFWHMRIVECVKKKLVLCLRMHEAVPSSHKFILSILLN